MSEKTPQVTVKQIKADKPYLVDVPVKINIWIRRECQRRQFEVIKQARPSILFVKDNQPNPLLLLRLIKLLLIKGVPIS